MKPHQISQMKRDELRVQIRKQAIDHQLRLKRSQLLSHVDKTVERGDLKNLLINFFNEPTKYLATISTLIAEDINSAHYELYEPPLFEIYLNLLKESLKDQKINQYEESLWILNNAIVGFHDNSVRALEFIRNNELLIPILGTQFLIVDVDIAFNFIRNLILIVTLNPEEVSSSSRRGLFSQIGEKSVCQFKTCSRYFGYSYENSVTQDIHLESILNLIEEPNQFSKEVFAILKKFNIHTLTAQQVNRTVLQYLEIPDCVEFMWHNILMDQRLCTLDLVRECLYLLNKVDDTYIQYLYLIIFTCFSEFINFDDYLEVSMEILKKVVNCLKIRDESVLTQSLTLINIFIDKWRETIDLYNLIDQDLLEKVYSYGNNDQIKKLDVIFLKLNQE